MVFCFTEGGTECHDIVMAKSESLHFLIVEDEMEISDILCLFLADRYSAEFTTVPSGNEAIALLKTNPRAFDLVLSDYNMADGNGYTVFQYLLKAAPDIPFVLITSDSWSDHPEFKVSERVGYVGKPFVEGTLTKEVDRLLAMSAIVPPEGQTYVPISVGALLNIRDIRFNIFVKINEDKYVRILNAGSTFGPAEAAKFKTKGVQNFYVEKENFSQLIEKFKNRVTNDMLFKVPANRTGDALQYSLAVQEVVLGAAKTFGLSPETQQLAMASFEIVKNVSEKIPELSTVFEWASFEEEEYNYSHSLLISLLVADVVRALSIQYPRAAEILAMVACFHDMALENHQVKNERRFIKALSLNSPMNRADMLAVKEHTARAIEILGEWETCPEDVIKVISEHHERPDGSGFPMGKRWDQLHELTACFIICEDLAQVYLELKDRAAVEKYFLAQAHIYQQGAFQKIHKYLCEKLSPVSKAPRVAG